MNSQTRNNVEHADVLVDARGPEGAEGLGAVSDSALLDALAEGFALKREADVRLLRLAAEVVERSRSSLGPNGLSIKAGSGTPAALLADLGRIALAEAHRLCRVAEATA